MYARQLEMKLDDQQVKVRYSEEVCKKRDKEEEEGQNIRLFRLYSRRELNRFNEKKISLRR